MIKKISIIGLFGLYNYEIQFDNSPNITIITGPNGFGKTTILQIINNLCSRNFWYFYFLPFTHISVIFTDGYTYLLTQDNYRDDNNNIAVNSVMIEVNYNERSIESGTINKEYINQLYRSYIYGRSDIHSFDRKDEYLGVLYRPLDDDYANETFPFASEHLSKQKCLVIEEQRLLEKNVHRRTILPEKIIDDIQVNISHFFIDAQKKYNQASLLIDGTFVKRLSDFSEQSQKKNIKKEKVFQQVKNKIADYKKYGLVHELDVVENLGIHYAEVLKLYLKDIYEKLMSIDSYYQKLSMFDRLVSGKRLSHKHLCFENGEMVIKDRNGIVVPINKLSSGEQNLLVLCYRLVFELEQNSLVMVDEPENSLHMSWLENLLSDYIEIASHTGCQIILATHSPIFIHGKWNLTYDLCEHGELQEP